MRAFAVAVALLSVACGAPREPAPPSDAVARATSLPPPSSSPGPSPPASTVAPSASAAEPEGTRPKGAPSAEVLAVAARGNEELAAVLPPGRLGEPTVTSRGGPAIFTFPRFDSGAGADAPPMGFLRVGAPDMGPYYEESGPDYPQGDVPVAEYIATKKLGPRIIEAATKLPDVVKMCAESKAQGAACLLWVSRMGKAKCDKGRSPLDACLWEVYVGSNMGTHASRLATVYVEPASFAVVAISDLGCPPMKLSGFRKMRAATKAGKPLDDCLDTIQP